MQYERPDFIDIAPARIAVASTAVAFAEPKHDGAWAWVVSDGHTATVTSRTGKALRTFPSGLRFVLAGEYMAGTQRAAASPLRGCVVVFDCLEDEGVCIEGLTLSERRAHAARIVAAVGAPLVLVEQVPACDAVALYRREIEAGGEGIVLKFDDVWGVEFVRAKRVCTIDAVCLGARGRSIEIGLYDTRGRLVSAGLISGGPKAAKAGAVVVGRVLRVVAMELTDAGSLRHGRFDSWHEDKPATSCTLTAARAASTSPF